jgi:hypothetical protein
MITKYDPKIYPLKLYVAVGGMINGEKYIENSPNLIMTR